MPIQSALTGANFNSRWVALRRYCQQAAPAKWYAWLADNGSLTQRLIKKSQGDFRVEVLKQGWALPTFSEAQALDMPTRQFALVREVRLMGKGQEWVFARSIIPASTLTGKQRQLRMLGNSSLGHLLFTDPSMRRGPLQISTLKLASDTQLWARRSVFYLSNKPLLVCEVFLPELLEQNTKTDTNLTPNRG